MLFAVFLTFIKRFLIFSYCSITFVFPTSPYFVRSYLFESSNEFGYFHTGKSGVAHSGDGGDHGDKWWLANESLLKYLNKKYIKIEKEIINLNKSHFI